jgi:hypothetical protein
MNLWGSSSGRGGSPDPTGPSRVLRFYDDVLDADRLGIAV